MNMAKIHHPVSCNFSNFNITKLNLLMKTFTTTCKRFTYLMANKHWLQDYMFMNNTHTKRVTKATIYLQAATIRLQTIEVSVQLASYILFHFINTDYYV